MNLIAALSKAASKNRSGITFITGDAAGKISYAALYQNALKVLGNLQRLGVKSGDEVVVQADDNQAFLNIFWGCILGGIIPVPLSTGIQDEQKAKLFKVWKYLPNPFLACDRQQWQRLQQPEAGEDGALIESRLLLIDSLLSNGEDGILAPVQGDEIAYLQFSSGSTGDPKGVCLTHDNLLCNIHDIIKSLEITDSDVLLNWMPLTHDMGMIGFHLTGVVQNIDTVSMATSQFIRRPLMWMKAASSYKATVLYSPNFGLQYFLSAFEKNRASTGSLSSVRIIVNGAEPISASLCQEFVSALQPLGLHSRCMLAAYGLAEASVEVSAMPPGSNLRGYSLDRNFLNTGDVIKIVDNTSFSGGSFADVGFPVSSCAVRICNDSNDVLNENTIGHIQIKGDNITSGYYNNPEATASLFTADGWLITGDLGFMREGRLVVTGRSKNIIIINGQNYYPHDIERVLIERGVAATGKIVACGVKNPATGKESLVIFVLYKKSVDLFAPLAATIRQIVQDTICIYADDVVPVTKIPKTTSGKVQHFLLRENYLKGAYKTPASIEDIESGSGDTPEQKLLHIAHSLFGHEVVTMETDLLKAGMNSLTAVQLANRIHTATGYQLPVDVLFQCKNLSSIVGYMHGAEKDISLPAPALSGSSSIFGLTHAQERIWMEYKLNPTSAAYNIPIVYRISGMPDEDLLEAAFREMIRKYEILRTSFELTEEGPKQKVHSYTPSLFRFEYTDLGSFPESWKESQLLSEQDANEPFVLEMPSSFRLRLIRLDEHEYQLVLVIHHILIDGWSLVTLVNDWASTYNMLLHKETGAGIKVAAMQFRVYVQQQERLLASEQFLAQRRYWLEELKGLPEAVDIKDSVAGRQKISLGHYRQTLSDDDFALLKGMALRFETTPFCILMAFLNTLLYRYTNRKDIVTGFDVAGRLSSQLEELVGYTLNTLCLRVAVDPDQAFPELVAGVKEKLALAMRNQSYPFELMLKDQEPDALLQGNALFKILVLYQSFHQRNLKTGFGDCTMQRRELAVKDGFINLLLEFTENGGGLEADIRYNENAYGPLEISQFADHLLNLLRAVAENETGKIGAYSFLTEQEKEMLLPRSSREEDILHDEKAIHLLFQQRAAATPGAIAVYAGEKTLTYSGLNKAANRLAHLIRRKGIQPDEKIGFLVKRNENLVLSILAILKSGAAYVALDPEFPDRRCEQIIAGSGMKYLLTDAAGRRRMAGSYADSFLIDINDASPELFPSSNPEWEGTKEHLAYVIYTSGSTGTPKGILIGHEALYNYVRQFISYFAITGDDIFIQQASVAFDTIVEEVFPALCTSGAIAIAPEGGKNIEELVSTINAFGATILSTTPLVLNEVNKCSAGMLSSLRLAISGGDVLYPSHINELFKRIPVYNTYGPSEATVCASYKKITALEDASLVGTPIAGCSIYILDGNRQLLPPGKTGEICIGGNLARGYLNLPALTEEKFIANPFDPGTRLYRTGDLGRMTFEGEVEFIGRSDYQVKVRGHRVELQEVEKLVCSHPAVKNAAVIQEAGAEYLIAFITTKEDLPASSLRQFLCEHLPVYMVPSRLVVLDELPFTTSGKVDNQRLSAYAASQPAFEEAAAQVTYMGRRLLEIIRSSLRNNAVGMTDNLFEQGCNSIAAVRIAGLIHKKLGYRLDIKDLFIYPAASLLAERLEQLQPSSWGHISPAGSLPYYELSPSQRRLWLLNRMDKHSVAYHEQVSYEVEGSLHHATVAEAFRILVARHEVLRTVFREVDGIPRQFILEAEDIPAGFLFEDISQGEDATAQALEKLSVQARLPFDLENGPLYRICMIRISADRCLLSVIMHHIITDDRSGEILLQEFSSILHSLQTNQPYKAELPKLHYKDYANWINASLQDEAMCSHRQYWKQLYSDGIPVLELPCDSRRPSFKKSDGDMVSGRIDKDILSRLRLLSREQNASLFMMLLSGVSTLLARYTAQYDLVIGVPVEGRDHPDLDNIPGFFINTLPLRVQFDPADEWPQLLRKVKQSTLEAYRHQAYPFDAMMSDLQVERNTSRAPLFDVLVNLHTLDRRLELSCRNDLSFKKINKNICGSKCDLAIYFEEYEDCLLFSVEYDMHLFSKERMERIALHLVRLFECFTRDEKSIVSKLDYLTRSEQARLLHGLNPPLQAPATDSVTSLFARQVSRFANKTAVSFGGRTLTYEELQSGSDDLARLLVQKYGVMPNDRVCLLLDRSPYIITSILASWKAGAAYIPLDTAFPDERLHHILDETGATLIITDETNLGKSQGLCTHIPRKVLCFDHRDMGLSLPGLPLVSNKCQGIAYIIYTSGSTGAPKGVEIPHQSLSNLLAHLQEEHKITPDDSYLSVSNYTFDISVSEFFLPLLSGAQLVLARKEEVLSMQLLQDLYTNTNPSWMQGTPSLWRALIDAGWNGSEKLRAITCGEPLPDDLRKKLIKRTGQLWNMYGPTETTIFSTGTLISSEEEPITIGKPVRNTRAYIADSFGGFVPEGVFGELYIAGDGLAHGYLGHPELTARKFSSGLLGIEERAYATGDICRWLPDGSIELRGRADSQVKIRGFRMELGEIENALTGHPLVRSAAVLVYEDLHEDKSLRAYILTNANGSVTEEEIRSYLRQRLPSYMVPASFVWLERMPLTSSGKINKKQLSYLIPKAGANAKPKELPKTKTEEQLLAIWEEMLGRKDVGTTESFFDLGGHSLKANQMVNQIYQRLGIDINLSDIFTHPTIQELGAMMTERDKAMYSYIELT